MKLPSIITNMSRRNAALSAVPVVLVIIFVVSYLSGGRYISTENAYVRSGLVMVSANVSGEVQHVDVVENQVVKEGDFLFSLDLTPFDLAVESAETALVEARNEIAIRRAALERVQTELEAAQEVEVYEGQELKRLEGLIASNAVSRARLAAQAHALEVARNNRASVEADIHTAEAELGGPPDQPTDTYPKVRSALVTHEQAKLNRKYASVQSRVSGIVARIDLHPGEYVREGAPVFSIVETGRVWIEANLKETQVTNVKVGQSATLIVDAYPGQEIEAIVTGLSPAAGSEYAILPPQNATGNWVKVNQRIPVRLEILGQPEGPVLRSGMTVEVTIDTEVRRGVGDLIAWKD